MHFIQLMNESNFKGVPASHLIDLKLENYLRRHACQIIKARQPEDIYGLNSIPVNVWHFTREGGNKVAENTTFSIELFQEFMYKGSPESGKLIPNPGIWTGEHISSAISGCQRLNAPSANGLNVIS